MTIERSNIVRHVSTPSMFYRVTNHPVNGEVIVKPYTLSLSAESYRAAVSDLTLVAVNEAAWRREETRFRADDWTFETIGSTVMAGVPMCLKVADTGEYKDFVSLSGMTFTLSDGSTLGRTAATAYSLGTADDWRTFYSMRGEQSSMVAMGTVIELETPTYGYTHAVLTGNGVDYPEQYVYGIDADTLEKTSRDFYVSVTVCKPTGKTLEEWRDSLAPNVAPGNVVLTREGKTVVIVSNTDTLLTVAELKADMSLGDESTLRRFDVAELLTEAITDSFTAEHTARLKTLEQLQALSINTVNRALQHASSNGYCSETLVALTGAGHKVPKVRVTGTVTIPLDIVLDAKQEWEKVRDIFGSVFGNSESWEAATLRRINLMSYVDMSEVAQNGGLTVEPVYGMPSVRPLA